MPHVNPVSWHCHGCLTFTEACIRKTSCPQCHRSQKSSNSKSVKSQTGLKLPPWVACLCPLTYVAATYTAQAGQALGKKWKLHFWCSGESLYPQMWDAVQAMDSDPISAGVEHTFSSGGVMSLDSKSLCRPRVFLCPFFPRLLFPRK